MPRKSKSSLLAIIPQERIEQRIFVFRGHNVMLSPHLAELYGVPAKQLNQAVKRNLDRFPTDFMFQLTAEEERILKSQFVTSSWGGARRARPYAFTEEGVAMLSAVLRSPTAVQVSIQIMRAFVRLRQLLASNDQLRQRLDELERCMVDHDRKFAAVFDAIRQLMAEPQPEKPKPPIGYHTEARGER